MERPEIKTLLELGPFPDSQSRDLNLIKRQQELISLITPPITDEEARALVNVFGPDDYFGLAWSLVHIIESAPGWPLAECLKEGRNEWIDQLRERARRGGKRVNP